jgi:hypothetical protein
MGGILIFLLSCESSVKADYDTIRAKKVILIGEDGKEYLLTVKKDSTGNPILGIEEN